jgi:hypothetical protein
MVKGGVGPTKTREMGKGSRSWYDCYHFFVSIALLVARRSPRHEKFFFFFFVIFFFLVCSSLVVAAVCVVPTRV